jgi:hypothetical protein
MTVNTSTKVANLNVDQPDGKDATEIGVNGLERVSSRSESNSNSPTSAKASCPSGKVLVGTGADISGGKDGVPPNQGTDVVIDAIIPSSTSVTVVANEETSTSANWVLNAYAICATAP